MTLLVASIAADDLDTLREQARRAWAGGADAVEIRLDTFDGDPRELNRYLSSEPHHTWIVTCRSRDEGGHFPGDTSQRVSLLLASTRGTSAFVDFELADWQRSSNIRQKIQLASARTDGEGHRLILSAHDFNGLPDDLETKVTEALAQPAASAAKVAYRARHITESFAAFDLLHHHGPRLTATAMSEEGWCTRVLAKKLGAFAAYCALTPDATTAPGQLTLWEMVERYRWNTVNADTKVYGVIADPVAHSQSPLLFNHWFAEHQQNAVYLPLRVGPEDEGLALFLDGCRKRPWLDIAGFSVTLPHKASALRWVGDGADRTALTVGAVNTLVFRDGGGRGYNTDCHAAIDSLVHALDIDRAGLAGVSVNVLGTGGAARAVLAGLRDFGARVTLYGRAEVRTRDLAETFRCTPASWESRIDRSGDVLINCTTVGMWPAISESPIPADALRGCRLVFDLIYHPWETLLLRHATALGAKTLNGLDMFLRQAAAQFVLWTGKNPDLGHAAEVVTAAILGRTEGAS